MDTITRPGTAARGRERTGLPSYKGALETLIPDVYIKRFPVNDSANSESTESDRKPRAVRSKRPRSDSHRK